MTVWSGLGDCVGVSVLEFGDVWACVWATLNGHLACLRYLLAEKAPFESDAVP